MYELETKIKLLDRLFNLVCIFSRENKVNGYCGNCGRAVFKLDSEWAEKGLCIYCFEMFEWREMNDNRK